MSLADTFRTRTRRSVGRKRSNVVFLRRAASIPGCTDPSGCLDGLRHARHGSRQQVSEPTRAARASSQNVWVVGLKSGRMYRPTGTIATMSAPASRSAESGALPPSAAGERVVDKENGHPCHVLRDLIAIVARAVVAKLPRPAAQESRVLALDRGDVLGHEFERVRPGASRARGYGRHHIPVAAGRVGDASRCVARKRYGRAAIRSRILVRSSRPDCPCMRGGRGASAPSLHRA